MATGWGSFSGSRSLTLRHCREMCGCNFVTGKSKAVAPLRLSPTRNLGIMRKFSDTSDLCQISK